MNYEINLGAWNQVFVVPSAVVDQHLKLAGSAQLKILLWLLRHAGEPCDPETIGQALGLSRADVCDAMQYWITAGLIRESDGLCTPPESEPVAASAAKPETPHASEMPAPEKKERPLTRPRQLNPAEIAGRIGNSKDINFLIEASESIFGRPLSTPEMGSLINLHDWDGLPSDVIIMAVQYAADNNKINMSYIEKMAVSWGAEGINTHEKAEEKIRQLDERKAAWSRVSRLFGIDKRPPSASESEAVTRWVNVWHFDDAMLQEAYNRCIDSTGKVKFQYINKILERWNSEGIRTIDDARADERKPTKSSGAPAKEKAQNRSYDLEQFEKMALYGPALDHHS